MLGNRLVTVRVLAIPATIGALSDEVYINRMRLESEAATGALTTLDHLRALVDQFDDISIDENKTISPTEQAIIAARNWVSYIDAVSKQ